MISRFWGGDRIDLVTPVDFDITEEQKNEISHRGKALRAMAQWLNGRQNKLPEKMQVVARCAKRLNS